MSKPLALIVEDEYDISIIFAKALQAAGFEVTIIRAGDAALVWLKSSRPDLILLDLNLPKVEGTEILRQIRADPRLEDVHVIVATAYSHMAESLHDTADWVFFKPVSFGDLRDLAARLGSSVPPREVPGEVTEQDVS